MGRYDGDRGVQINEKYFDGKTYLDEVVMSKCSTKCSVGRPQCTAGPLPFVPRDVCWLWSVGLSCAFCVFSSPVLQMSSPDHKGLYFNIFYLCRNDGKIIQAVILNG